MRKDEADLVAAGKGAAVEKARDCARGVEWELNERRWYVWHEIRTTLRDGAMHENHRLTSIETYFIERTGTKHFGLLIDTGIFQDRPLPYWPGETPEMRRDFLNGIHVNAADFLLVAKYVVFIQAKFHNINDELHDEHIPWEPVIAVLKQAGYTGYLSSEYEGARDPWRSLEQVRRQHALIRKLERQYDSGR